MSGFNSTTAAGILKTLYPTHAIELLIYKLHPWLALCPKNENGKGDQIKVPLVYGAPSGRSNTFVNAQSRSTTSSTSTTAFFVPWTTDYAVVTVSNLLIEQSRDDEGSFVRGLKLEMDNAFKKLANSIHSKMFRAGWGDIGQIGALSSSAASFTLSQSADSVQYEVGDQLVLSVSQSGAATRALGSSGNPLFVTQVDRQNGILTFGYPVNDAVNGVVTPTVGDWIFAYGDRQTSSTPSMIALTGLAGWLPYGGPASSSFFGVNRTADVLRLAGLSYNGVGQTVEEALINAGHALYKEEGIPDIIIMSPRQRAQLVSQLGSKVRYDLAQVKGDDDNEAVVSFDTVEINLPGGNASIVADPKCPDSYAYMLESDQWELVSMGKLTRMFKADGADLWRQPTDDGVEFRVFSYANLVCYGPGHNAVVALTPLPTGL